MHFVACLCVALRIHTHNVCMKQSNPLTHQQSPTQPLHPKHNESQEKKRRSSSSAAASIDGSTTVDISASQPAAAGAAAGPGQEEGKNDEAQA